MSAVKPTTPVQAKPEMKPRRRRVEHWYWGQDRDRALAEGRTSVRSLCGLARVPVSANDRETVAWPLSPAQFRDDCKRCRAVLDARDRRWVNGQLKELEKQFR